MYNNFFGLKEKPFKLVPNPAYLFLSKSHEEALAHLAYAVSQGDGFVEITGEVGTGKTTLCRSFLENLDESVEAAYIFNPKLDAVQLIKAINDEFGVDSSPATVKELIDLLNAFLMSRKGAGKKVLLLVDEAQNLGKDVLEQLRLLSNLETTRDKLLQIILVGQPELAEMLASHDLRQLGQRITLRCRLAPLTIMETQEYLLHRIAVAAVRPALKFDSAAIRRMHKYARGVPRLINIVADRSLLVAYGCNSHVITEEIVKTAIAELATGSVRGLRALGLPPKALAGFAFAALVVVAMVFFFRPAGAPPNHAAPVPAVSSVAPSSAPSLAAQPVPPVVQEPDAGHEVGLGHFLTTLSYKSSRRAALLSALEEWDAGLAVRDELDEVNDDQTFFRLAGEQNGFMMRRVTRFDFIKSLGLPAVLALRIPGEEQPRYLVVGKVSSSIFSLRAGDSQIEAGEASIRNYWTGMAYLPWKNFMHIAGTIPRNAPDESVLSFKMLLRDIGYPDVVMTPDYDGASEEIVRDLQRKYGLEADGKVGPLTKIILYREANRYQMPQIYSLAGLDAGDIR